MPLSRTTTGRFANRIFRQSLTAQRYQSTGIPSSEVIDTDVVIVGGGPAGLALASTLGSSESIRNNLKVTLVDGGDLSKIKTWNAPPTSFSNRVVSLTNKSKAFLTDIGAWDHVDEARTNAVEHMQVWDGVSDARIEFDAQDLQLTRVNNGMATLTEILNLQRALLRHLDNLPNIQLLHRTKVTSITADSEDKGSWPLIHLDNNSTLRARLLVGADGFNSPVRTFAQIPSFGWGYNTQAIVATLVHPPRGAFEGPNTTAYQRFLPTGPIAFLPLSPTMSSLVWSTKPALAAALQAADPNVLAIMINAAFRLPHLSMKYLHQRILESHAAGISILPDTLRQELQFREQSHAVGPTSAYSSLQIIGGQQGIPPADSEMVPPLVTQIQAGTVASFPLKYNHAETYLGEGVGARTVLVGDAAHTIHPLAGQGLNLGLGDVESLANCITATIATGGDIGSYTSLLRYSQSRYLANHTVMSAVDKLHKLYSTDSDAIVWARSVGVEVLNELDSVKAAMMMSAGADFGNVAPPSWSASGWNIAASGVEILAKATKTAEAVGNTLTSTIGANLSTFIRSTRP
ncbi:hypothetical protein CPB83DRAFT_761042 [Crepidotus variabilis]|uniref:Ubiquinone biosynthesis monooxygenase COQ6, mitochondrial n=1 Tax=Crepidotus variabilis TaxID=179855 RepID=A0A9P6EL40_9AGAR|nr:hypothetical protein CPB83DRAFT_761042 [Crepidotus variabilis]